MAGPGDFDVATAEIRAVALQQADLVLADGMAIVWASRILGQPLPERVAGIDLFQNLLGVAAREAFRRFLPTIRRRVTAS